MGSSKTAGHTVLRMRCTIPSIFVMLSGIFFGCLLPGCDKSSRFLSSHARSTNRNFISSPNHMT